MALIRFTNWDEPFGGWFGPSFTGAEFRRNECVPPANIYEDGEHYFLTLEVPGTAKEDISIGVEDHTLTVRGERKPPYGEHQTVYRSECPYGEFERSFVLGEHVDVGAVEADLKDGVLTVRLGKRAEMKARRVEVKD